MSAYSARETYAPTRCDLLGDVCRIRHVTQTFVCLGARHANTEDAARIAWQPDLARGRAKPPGHVSACATRLLCNPEHGGVRA
eukprot:3590096-Prymnesium_polylepis.1